MTRLRKMMLEELQRRNFSQHTIRYYIHTVEDFTRHFNRAPDRLREVLRSGNVVISITTCITHDHIPWEGVIIRARIALLPRKEAKCAY